MTDTMHWALSRWFAVAESRIGRGHVREGIPCQDASHVSTDNDVISIVVSDGAGSARHSEHGADAVVAATERVLRSTLPWEAHDDASLRAAIINACRREINAKSRQLGCSVSALAATLAFVAVDSAKQSVLCGNLGDGIVAGRRQRQIEIIIPPYRGEFVNQTVFVTSDDCYDNLRISRDLGNGYDGFAIMSDGSAESLYTRKTQSLSPAILTIMAWFDNNPPCEVAHAIASNVLSEIVERTLDDCSLAMLRKVHVSADNIGAKSEPFLRSFLGLMRPINLRNRVKIYEACQKYWNVHDLVKATGLSAKAVRRHRRALLNISDRPSAVSSR